MIKDFYCNFCKNEKYNVVVASYKVVDDLMFCSKCNQSTSHSVLCNGGTGKRYHFNDWNIDDLRKDVRLIKTGTTTDGKPNCDEHGTPYADNKKYSMDSIAERREALESRQRANRVGKKLFLDMRAR